MTTTHSPLPKETEMERAIRDLVTTRGGIVWSVRDSRGLNIEHMPDLILVCPWLRAVYFLELKSQTRVVTDGQWAAIGKIDQCPSVYAHLVRPNPRDESETSYDRLLEILGGEGV